MRDAQTLQRGVIDGYKNALNHILWSSQLKLFSWHMMAQHRTSFFHWHISAYMSSSFPALKINSITHCANRNVSFFSPVRLIPVIWHTIPTPEIITHRQWVQRRPLEQPSSVLLAVYFELWFISVLPLRIRFYLVLHAQEYEAWKSLCKQWKQS